MYLVGSYAFINDHITFKHTIPSISITFTHIYIGEEVHEEVNPKNDVELEPEVATPPAEYRGRLLKS
jgi:hypothetical protein